MWSENDLKDIFVKTYYQLLPDSKPPDLRASFYPFANLNHTIRVRRGRIIARISDICRDAPLPVLNALAHILLSKLYRRKPERDQLAVYRAYMADSQIKERIRLVRRSRGRKLSLQPEGKAYDLAKIFEKLNEEFFGGKVEIEQIGWSKRPSIRYLGHYDHVRNAIIVSSALDDPKVPRYLVEYIVYHEMLHSVHDDKVSDGRRFIHHEEFKADEMRFPYYSQAKSFLRRYARARSYRSL